MDAVAFPSPPLLSLAPRQNAARRRCRAEIASEPGTIAPYRAFLGDGPRGRAGSRRSGTVIQCAVAARDGTLATTAMRVKQTLD